VEDAEEDRLEDAERTVGEEEDEVGADAVDASALLLLLPGDDSGTSGPVLELVDDPSPALELRAELLLLAAED